MGLFIFIIILFGALAYGIYQILISLFPLEISILWQISPLLPIALPFVILVLCALGFAGRKPE